MFPEWVRDPNKAHMVSILSNPSSWVGNKMLSEVGSYYFLSDEIGQRIFLWLTASRQGAEWGKIRVSMTCLDGWVIPWNCGWNPNIYITASQLHGLTLCGCLGVTSLLSLDTYYYSSCLGVKIHHQLWSCMYCIQSLLLQLYGAGNIFHYKNTSTWMLQTISLSVSL